MHLSCPADLVIHIGKAVYGRIQAGDICPHPMIQTTECESETSTDIVKNLCQGMTSCHLKASNAIFDDPCTMT
ncbi:hypothetical protein DPMN_114429 [Dreissena polymorpha]|uniref:SUEL-type lectin domain-containing protein n=1 Tax=Dreissena polymorpha TaxID=45954 RepID=A0A9D4KK01_DREPO|nr:hypothetical protein DPMN_114428 [Dreissena polymorpha]KAH3840971.1 hypothetical protein DPMN_114429 [Dreissena polymorpha]